MENKKIDKNQKRKERWEEQLKNKNEPPLNSIEDFVTKANVFLNQLNPKNGKFIVGNIGVEWRASLTDGFIKIPYKEIKQVKVQIVFKKWVRSIQFITKDDKVFQFVPNKGDFILYVLSKHLDKKQIVDNKGLEVRTPFKKKTAKNK